MNEDRRPDSAADERRNTLPIVIFKSPQEDRRRAEAYKLGFHWLLVNKPPC